MDILDVLLDEENCAPITLCDEDHRAINFEQVAVIPYKDKIYCILKPLDCIDGVADDEAIVFYVDESGEKNELRAELNQMDAMCVFEEYYDLLEEDMLKRRGQR